MEEAGALVMHEYESTFDKNVISILSYSYSFLNVSDIYFHILQFSYYIMYNNKDKKYT